MLEKNTTAPGVAFQRVSVHHGKNEMDVLIGDWRETLPSTTTKVELVDSRDCSSCSVIVRVSVVLKRTVGDSD